MFRKKAKVDAVPPAKPASAQVDQAPRLRAILDEALRFYATGDQRYGFAPVNLAQMIDRSRVWDSLAAWSANPAVADADLTVAKIAAFTLVYHEQYVPKQPERGEDLFLGEATSEVKEAIFEAGLEACGRLAPNVVVDPSDQHEGSARAVRGVLAERLGRPADVLDGSGEDHTHPHAGPELSDDSAALIQAAVVASTSGDDQRALELLEEGARLGSVQAMRHAGIMAEKLGRKSVARFWIEAAAAGDPESIFNMGVLAIQAGELDSAEAWFCRAIDAGWTVAWGARIQMAEDSGDLGAARDHARKGADAGDPHSMVVLGTFLATDEEPDVDEALALFERAAATGSSEAMVQAGMLSWAMDDSIHARYWFGQAVAAGDQQASALMAEYGLETPPIT